MIQLGSVKSRSVKNFWKSRRHKRWDFRFYLNNEFEFLKNISKSELCDVVSERRIKARELLIEFVSFGIYCSFIWDTAGYATTRSPCKKFHRNNKQANNKANIQIKSLWELIKFLWNITQLLSSFLWVLFVIDAKMSLTVCDFCDTRKKRVITKAPNISNRKTCQKLPFHWCQYTIDVLWDRLNIFSERNSIKTFCDSLEFGASKVSVLRFIVQFDI